MSKNWKTILNKEYKSDYFIALNNFIENERINHSVYPQKKDIFNAFELTSFDNTKIVLLGQDPYHGEGQAHGLSFSVKETKIPPSLKNIFKELNSDLGIPISKNGDLSYWAKQGVLLLNTTLTVRESKPASHQKQGWETFTDNIIKTISKEKDHVLFLLWGRFAQNKASLINENKHTILTAPHPSPFSAHKGFFGCKHFSKANEILMKKGVKPIDWHLPSPILDTNQLSLL